jgi:hypothetical protein
MGYQDLKKALGARFKNLFIARIFQLQKNIGLISVWKNGENGKGVTKFYQLNFPGKIF